MTIISGWAYSPREDEIRAENASRLRSLLESGVKVEFSDRFYEGQRCIHKGRVINAPSELTDRDILLFCDKDACFGASVERDEDGSFTCKVYTD